MYSKTKFDFHPTTMRHMMFYGVMVRTLDFESSDPGSNSVESTDSLCCLFKKSKQVIHVSVPVFCIPFIAVCIAHSFP